MGYYLQMLASIFGIELGYRTSKEIADVVSEQYRAKDFDPVVRRDLIDLLSKGRLSKIRYPFPLSVQQKKEIFFLRHKVFSASLLLCLIAVMLIGKSADFIRENTNIVVEELLYNVVIVFWIFWLICIVVMLVKKVIRGGKKVSDYLFQTEFINQGKEYWKVREYVREALESQVMTLDDAYYRIWNTELGRQLPDSEYDLQKRIRR